MWRHGAVGPGPGAKRGRPSGLRLRVHCSTRPVPGWKSCVAGKHWRAAPVSAAPAAPAAPAGYKAGRARVPGIQRAAPRRGRPCRTPPAQPPPRRDQRHPKAHHQPLQYRDHGPLHAEQPCQPDEPQPQVVRTGAQFGVPRFQIELGQPSEPAEPQQLQVLRQRQEINGPSWQQRGFRLIGISKQFSRITFNFCS